MMFSESSDASGDASSADSSFDEAFPISGEPSAKIHDCPMCSVKTNDFNEHLKHLSRSQFYKTFNVRNLWMILIS